MPEERPAPVLQQMGLVLVPRIRALQLLRVPERPQARVPEERPAPVLQQLGLVLVPRIRALQLLARPPAAP